MTIIPFGITAAAELVEPGSLALAQKHPLQCFGYAPSGAVLRLQHCDLCAGSCSGLGRDEVPDKTPRPVDEDELVG